VVENLSATGGHFFLGAVLQQVFGWGRVIDGQFNALQQRPLFKNDSIPLAGHPFRSHWLQN